MEIFYKNCLVDLKWLFFGTSVSLELFLQGIPETIHFTIQDRPIKAILLGFY